MVIGFDGSRAFNEQRTGTENYSSQLLRALAKIDRKNRYIIYLRPSASLSVNLQGSAPTHAGQDWPGNFQFSVLSFQSLWTQLGLSLQTFKDRLDVLFVPAHTLPVIRKPGLKTVVTVHDLGSEYLPGMHQLKQRLYLGFMQKYQLRGADRIIAVSQATKADLVKKLGLVEKKISVVYEGYDKKLFKPAKGDILVNTLIHYNLQPKSYFLFVGTVQPRKNLMRVIQAFSIYLSLRAPKGRGPLRLTSSEASNLPRKIASSSFNKLRTPRNDVVDLVIAGSKGWLYEPIYKLPKQLGIEDQVKFLGYVPEGDLPALYSGAAALIFPSLFEGFGLPILEAQACGCPVLTSNVSSMPEVAGNGAVYVDPYDIDDIVRGMERVQGTGYRVQLIKAGFENTKRFSWEKCARETLKVFQKLKS